LYDYLAQQVLDQQSTEVREFLIRTSLFEEFNEELCKNILGDENDISSIIDIISTKNLFILPIGDGGEWLRYHHLFRDFLQARMARERPVEREEILHRLAKMYQDLGEYEKSYATYKRLGNLESTARLVAHIGSLCLKVVFTNSSYWLGEYLKE
jgi:LuxR family maltose regulon positive regulatory protein